MTATIKTTKKCIICGNTKLFLYLDLGKSPLANSYVKKSDLQKREVAFPLRVFYCNHCHLAQLTDVVDRKLLFDDYAYFSSTSPQLHQHFKDYANEVFSAFPVQAKQFTLEIASNDGILLKYFQKLGAKVLGVDPAKNIAKMAQKNGVDTLPVFFNSNVAQSILKKYGHAGVISANNVLAHTDDLRGIIKGVKKLLDLKGVFVFEVQYLGDLLQKNEFDNTYHEHICYFSLAPLMTLLEKHGLHIFDVKHVETQGGSLRVYAGHTPLLFPVNNSVKNLLLQEKKQGLYNITTYQNFGKRLQKTKNNFLEVLQDIKLQNKKIAGYGAAAKTTTLLAYCGIGKNIIDYIVDDSPHKQEKYMPGNHIPIVSSKELKKNTPDYVVLFAWNYADSIIKRESWLKEKGVKFIKPIPNVQII